MAFSNRREIAIHEAAHAIVGNAVGGDVLAIDIGNGPEKQRKAYTNWPFNPATLKTIDWLDEDAAAAARAAVRNIVTCFVAGEVAEKEVRPMQTLSERVDETRFVTEGDEPRGRSDLDIAIWLLSMAGIGSMEEVRAAERRAKEIIDANRNKLDALADKLLEDGYVDGDELNMLLGK